MVGDRHHDVHGAKKSGIPVIGVTYGYGSREELTEAGADHIVDTVEDLTKIFTVDNIAPCSIVLPTSLLRST